MFPVRGQNYPAANGVSALSRGETTQQERKAPRDAEASRQTVFSSDCPLNSKHLQVTVKGEKKALFTAASVGVMETKDFHVLEIRLLKYCYAYLSYRP